MCLAIPGRVIAIADEERRLAKVNIAGVERLVDISLLDSEDTAAAPDDWVLIHVGFAIARMNAEEAAATLRMLQAMGTDYQQEIAQLEAQSRGDEIR